MKTRENRNTDKVYQKQAEITTKKAEKAKQLKKRREIANQVAIASVIDQAKLPADTCPACQEKTLQVDKSKNRFSCQSCRKHGNAIRFVMLSLGLSDWKATSYLEQISSSSVNPTKKTPLKKKISLLSSKTTNLKPICEREVERLKEEISLLDLMKEEGLEFRRVGKDHFSRCPFHQDKTPSLSVSQNNLWHCFSCGRGGTVLDWVMKNQKISFLEAGHVLREKYPHLQSGSSPSPLVAKKEVTPVLKPENPSQSKLLKQTIEYYHQSLLKSPKALEYLAKRGIHSPELITKFRLGFADRSLGLKIPRKRSKGGEVREQLEELGLFRSSGHEHFAGSIVVPIISANGEITEVYGRKINDRLRAGTSYHLYLPGSHRGIFNPSCLGCQEIILCESLFDALSFWANGFCNVTASYGTQGFTAEYLSAFQQSKPKRIYIAYDNDEAGNKAALKLAEKLIPLGMECSRVVFPSGQDANEFACQAQSPQKQLQQHIDQAVDLRQYFPSLVVKDPKKEIGKNKKEETAKEKKMEIPEQYRLSPKVEGENVEILIEERRYRIRGLYKNNSFDSLRINIRVFIGNNFHVDTLELFNARQRFGFIKTTAQELGINIEIIKLDVGRILLSLEELQKKYIEETMNPKTKEVILSEQEKKEAIALLRTPQLAQRIVEDYARCGLVGERTNILVCYLALISRKLKDPLAVIVQALSSSGKSMLMNTALSFVPEEDVVKYTAMTGQSLFYMGEENLVHKTLAISEEEGAEKASYAIKIMQSEKSLCIASTGKEPKSGRFTTHEYKVKGPTQVFMTTTSEEIEEEFQNRCLVLTTVADSSQTKAIHARQREQETLNGMLQEQCKDKIVRLHQNAQRLLRPMMVVNPYAKQLTFLDSHLRSRRDHVKYLTLIRTITFLHQYQRPIKRVKHDNEIVEYIEVIPEDIAIANRLVNEIMGNCLGELAPQTRKFLRLITQMVKERIQAEQVSQDKCLFTRKQARDYTGWSNTQVKLHLDRLVDLEYILARSGSNGLRYEYQLLYSGEGQSGTPFLMGLLDTRQLKSQMEEKAKLPLR